MSQPARVLEVADVRRLLHHVKAHRYPSRSTAIILLSFKAGLRACEMAGLDWTMVLKPSNQLGDHIAIARTIAKKRFRTPGSDQPRTAERVGFAAQGSRASGGRRGDPV